MRKRTLGNPNGVLLSVEQSAINLNLGRDTVMKLAREAGAVVKIGRSVRINRAILEKYVLETYAE